MKRFSIRQLLLFMLFVALVISNVLTLQRMRGMESELTQLRQEQGRLVLSDRDKINLIHVPTPEKDKSWSWRIYAPPGTEMDLCLCTRGIPTEGLPDTGTPYIRRMPVNENRLLGSSPNGTLVTMAVKKRTKDGEPGWQLSCYQGNTFAMGWVLPDDVTERSPITNFAARDGQETSKVSEPLVLLRQRFGIESTETDGSRSTRWPVAEPLDGILVWLEPRAEEEE